MGVLRIKPLRPETLFAIDERKARQMMITRLNRIGKRITRLTLYNINGRLLNRRTGNLYRSFGHTIKRITDGYRLTQGSDGSVAYDKIHDRGGWTGRGHRSKMPRTAYHRIAVVKSKDFIRKQLEQFAAELIK